MLKKAGDLFTTAYLLLIFGVYPFYMNQGYEDIGEAKYRFFIYSSLAAAGILALIGVLLLLQHILDRGKEREAVLFHWEKLSATDLFVLLYAVEVFFSYMLSDYKEEALWGTEGWHMGTVLLLTLCALYFLISRLWIKKESVRYIAVAASGAVFLLGILDRFSIYLLPLEIRDSGFISTLGNINWFCGYLSVLSPIGICGFLFGQGKKRRLCGLYAVIAFMAGFSQGSSSIFLFYGGLFGCLLWFAVQKREWFRDYFLLIFLWALSAQLVRLLRVTLPEHYNYDVHNLCGYLTDSDFTIWAGAGALAVYGMLLFTGKGAFDERRRKKIQKGMIVLLAGSIALWLFVSLVNTRIGISWLAGVEIFRFSDAWGNGRGAAISAGLSMFGEMPLLYQIMGIGADCFSVYAYSLPEIALQLREAFGGSRLTNAHNEFLTGLINTGILGIGLYAGIFLSFLKGCVRKGTEIYGVCVFCYLIHNMVSFAHVLNLPFLFLFLAMGEAQETGKKFTRCFLQ